MFVTFDDRVDSALHAIRSAFAGLHGKDALQYLVKAVLLAAFLTLAGSCATSLPWFAFPPMFLIPRVANRAGPIPTLSCGNAHRS